MDAEGFTARYDFLYLPAELRTGVCFGYAFINMVTAADAQSLVGHFQGFEHWPVSGTGKKAEVHLSESLQGLEEQIARYRNSPLMHPKVPDRLRPAMYKNGVRTPFPKPALSIRRPRLRNSEAVRSRRTAAAETNQ